MEDKPMEKQLKKQRRRYIAWGCAAALVILLAVMPMAASGGDDTPQAAILSGQVTRQELETQILGGGLLSGEGALSLDIPADVKITEYLVSNGDSVTEGYWGLKEKGQWYHRWQEQFVRALRSRFPNARISLATEGWGGHNTTHYLASKPGELHSYQDKVLNRKPDLLIFEFLNDSGMRNPLLTRQYERILKDLRNANPNMEIIAILPHHTSEGRNIDGNDDRPYISQLREFCIRHNLVFADVSLRYSRLHRQGIPPMLLMVNNHNHPLKEGMKLFSDTLLELFPEK